MPCSLATRHQQKIRELEDELGVEIFVRRASGSST
jgi:DNA-binding transcriptional LysR family regulator